MHRLFALFLVWIFPAFAQVTPESASQSETVIAINKVRSGVVRVAAVVRQQPNQPNGLQIPSGPIPLGSGFIVSQEGYVITNAHVVGACLGCQYYIEFSVPTVNTPQLKIKLASRLVEAKLIDQDAANDVALLKFDPDVLLMPFVTVFNHPEQNVQTRFTPLRLNPLIPDEGTDVLASGFPYISPSTESATFVSQKGIVASKAFRMVIANGVGAPESDLVFLDIEINHGNSGGPAYLLSGEVIGITEGYMPAMIETQILGKVVNSGICFMVPIKYAISLLDKNKVKYN
jgi:serine protease Do